MFESKRVYMVVEDAVRDVHIDNPVAYVYQMIENPLLATTILKEMLIYQELGFTCQLYVEGQKRD